MVSENVCLLPAGEMLSRAEEKNKEQNYQLSSCFQNSIG